MQQSKRQRNTHRKREDTKAVLLEFTLPLCFYKRLAEMDLDLFPSVPRMSFKSWAFSVICLTNHFNPAVGCNAKWLSQASVGDSHLAHPAGPLHRPAAAPRQGRLATTRRCRNRAPAPGDFSRAGESIGLAGLWENPETVPSPWTCHGQAWAMSPETDLATK